MWSLTIGSLPGCNFLVLKLEDADVINTFAVVTVSLFYDNLYLGKKENEKKLLL